MKYVYCWHTGNFMLLMRILLSKICRGFSNLKMCGMHSLFFKRPWLSQSSYFGPLRIVVLAWNSSITLLSLHKELGSTPKSYKSVLSLHEELRSTPKSYNSFLSSHEELRSTPQSLQLFLVFARGAKEHTQGLQLFLVFAWGAKQHTQTLQLFLVFAQGATTMAYKSFACKSSHPLSLQRVWWHVASHTTHAKDFVKCTLKYRKVWWWAQNAMAKFHQGSCILHSRRVHVKLPTKTMDSKPLQWIY
jgi:hypothetical protein